MDDHTVAAATLGVPGEMISGSKRNPPGREDHTIYWNACVFVKTGRKDAEQVWYGDLDLTSSEKELRELARRLGRTVYVTPERPWRFDGFRETMKHGHDDRVVVFEAKGRSS